MSELAWIVISEAPELPMTAVGTLVGVLSLLLTVAWVVHLYS